jgi:hypothetical protein
MRRKVGLIVAAGLAWAFLLTPGAVLARPQHSSPTRQYWHRSSGHPSGPVSSEGAGSSGTHQKSSARCTTCPRDEHGRIKRSGDAKRDFKRQTGYPKGRKGYVIDHVVPLACGGADAPSNMQWQTKDEARAKDRLERSGCKR